MVPTSLYFVCTHEFMVKLRCRSLTVSEVDNVILRLLYFVVAEPFQSNYIGCFTAMSFPTSELEGTHAGYTGSCTSKCMLKGRYICTIHLLSWYISHYTRHILLKYYLTSLGAPTPPQAPPTPTPFNPYK